MKLLKNDDSGIINDPNITKEFEEWTISNPVNNFNKLILDAGIFSGYQISRQVHLNFVLNILATVKTWDFSIEI